MTSAPSFNLTPGVQSCGRSGGSRSRWKISRDDFLGRGTSII